VRLGQVRCKFWRGRWERGEKCLNRVRLKLVGRDGIEIEAPTPGFSVLGGAERVVKKDVVDQRLRHGPRHRPAFSS